MSSIRRARTLTLLPLLVSPIIVCAMSDGMTRAPIPPGLHITLLRNTGGFEYRPIYTVTVAEDGQVDFEGGAVVPTHHAHYRVDPARLSVIVAAIKQADFNDMQNSYMSPQDGCNRFTTDEQVMKITVANAKSSKSVDFSYGCDGTTPPTARARIIQLARTIDQQLGINRWLGVQTASGNAPVHPSP